MIGVGCWLSVLLVGVAALNEVVGHKVEDGDREGAEQVFGKLAQGWAVMMVEPAPEVGAEHVRDDEDGGGPERLPEASHAG